MSEFDASALPFVLLGLVAGTIGFLPLYGAVRSAHRGRRKPEVAKGFAAIGASFAFLLAFEAVSWLLAPENILAILAGMVVGFFAMWGVLAFLVLRHWN